jgi:hypothetical protein
MRARNIKPGFFKNEDIAELSPIDRLFFIGMWCAADREGRLVDRPKRIKMDVLPCDNYDAEKGIQRLVERGFVERYTASGQAVIQIVNFLKHQTPHSLEKDSELPDKDGKKTVHERKNGRICSAKKQFLEPLDEKEKQIDNSSITENTVFDNTLDVLDSLDSKEKSKASALSEIPPQADKAHPPATDAGRACVLMRNAGCGITNPSHPDLLAALAAGVTPEALADAVAEAVELKKSKPFAWAIATARGRHDESAKPTTGASHAKPRQSLADQSAQRAKEIFNRIGAENPDDDLGLGNRRLGASLDVATR